MADASPIEWTDATWNVVTGCSVVSPGCTNCYAMRLAGSKRAIAAHPSRVGLTRDTKAGPVWTGEVRFNEEWLHQPLHWRRPRKIFVCAHGDLFHENVPDEWIDRVFAVMALAPQHTFQVLTKRADRMRQWFERYDAVHDHNRADYVADQMAVLLGVPGARGAARTGEHDWDWPLRNVWLGVSVEDQARADERIPQLLSTPAAVRWLSMEPLLGPVDLRGYIRGAPGMGHRAWSTWKWPDWVPGEVRAQVEDFWRAAYGRGPDAWLRGAINNGQPPLGTEGEFTLCRTGEPLVEGRFIPAWNNIGRVLDADGRLHVVSAGTYTRAPYIDWVVVGGESGADARPMHPDWARGLRDQCAAAGVPFLFKQWGEWRPSIAGRGILSAEGSGPMDCAWPDGTIAWGTAEQHGGPGQFLERAGKKVAGRRLDGRTHDDFPQPAPVASAPAPLGVAPPPPEAAEGSTPNPMETI